jgi:hypothetical protein
VHDLNKPQYPSIGVETFYDRIRREHGIVIDFSSDPLRIENEFKIEFAPSVLISET